MHKLVFRVVMANCLSPSRNLAGVKKDNFIGACRGGQQWNQSAIQPASVCTVGNSLSTLTELLVLHLPFCCSLITLMKYLFFSHHDVLSFSAGLLKDPGSDAWVKVLSSLDCKCSFEPQAIPCSITWRRNMPNTLSTPVSRSHLLCACKLATDVLWGESFELPC